MRIQALASVATYVTCASIFQDISVLNGSLSLESELSVKSARCKGYPRIEYAENIDCRNGMAFGDVCSHTCGEVSIESVCLQKIVKTETMKLLSGDTIWKHSGTCKKQIKETALAITGLTTTATDLSTCETNIQAVGETIITAIVSACDSCTAELTNVACTEVSRRRRRSGSNQFQQQLDSLKSDKDTLHELMNQLGSDISLIGDTQSDIEMKMKKERMFTYMKNLKEGQDMVEFETSITETKTKIENEMKRLVAQIIKRRRRSTDQEFEIDLEISVTEESTIADKIEVQTDTTTGETTEVDENSDLGTASEFGESMTTTTTTSTTTVTVPTTSGSTGTFSTTMTSLATTSTTTTTTTTEETTSFNILTEVLAVVSEDDALSIQNIEFEEETEVSEETAVVELVTTTTSSTTTTTSTTTKPTATSSTTTTMSTLSTTTSTISATTTTTTTATSSTSMTSTTSTTSSTTTTTTSSSDTSSVEVYFSVSLTSSDDDTADILEDTLYDSMHDLNPYDDGTTSISVSIDTSRRRRRTTNYTASIIVTFTTTDSSVSLDDDTLDDLADSVADSASDDLSSSELSSFVDQSDLDNINTSYEHFPGSGVSTATTTTTTILTTDEKKLLQEQINELESEKEALNQQMALLEEEVVLLEESQLSFKRKMKKQRLMSYMRNAQVNQELLNLRTTLKEAEKQMTDQMYIMVSELMG